jgi:hypothetical protein
MVLLLRLCPAFFDLFLHQASTPSFGAFDSFLSFLLLAFFKGRRDGTVPVSLVLRLKW